MVLRRTVYVRMPYLSTQMQHTQIRCRPLIQGFVDSTDPILYATFVRSVTAHHVTGKLHRFVYHLNHTVIPFSSIKLYVARVSQDWATGKTNIYPTTLSRSSAMLAELLHERHRRPTKISGQWIVSKYYRHSWF